MASKKILLLEDTPREMARLTKALEEAGFSVISFEHPNLARAHFKRNEDVTINAVVSDWNMGKDHMTGLDFLQSVRHGSYSRTTYKSKIPQKIPFVMCSAYDPNVPSEAKYKKQAMTNGANFYQIKCSMYSLQPMIDFLNTTLNA